MSITKQLDPFSGDTIAAKIQNPFETKVDKGGTRPIDFPGGFTITEYVDGQAAQTIRLQGNMMPFQPFQWGGEQRIVKEYYPGNPEPATQVLGGKESDLVIHGRFKDKKYRDSSLYGVSYQYALLLDEIRKRGNLVRFGMEGQVSWVRWGFLEKSDFKMNKASWIEYEISFIVVSEHQPKNNYFVSGDKTSPTAINQTLIDKAAAFQASYSATPKTMPQSLADKINGFVSNIATQVNLVTNFVSTVISTAQDIQKSANRAIGLVRNARTNLVKFQRQIGTFTQGFSTLSSSGSPAQQSRDTFTNAQFIHNARNDAMSVDQFLAQLQAQFDKISKTLPLARYKVIAGDTLQNISVKFYNDSSHWQDIYDHNKLTSQVLAAGKVLEIPKL